MARRKNNKRGSRLRDTSSWVEIPKENEKWEKYYKSLNVLPESEWEQFKLACQKQLPLTFRITGLRSHAGELREVFKTKHVPYLQKAVLEDSSEPIEAPAPLLWYPDELAWQLDIPKLVMKKNELFKRTQRFLVVETEVGNISRQEAVLMIPPLLLDVKSNHYVLDMCAAPGLKTAQLIEALHDTEEPIPQGFIMANDSDYRRLHMLVHQVKRLNLANFVVVNHDAQMMPKFKIDGHFAKFDRVLCDVPCTGDGTMRKNVTVWKDWSIGNGLGLHLLQVNILQRGLQLLKKGGRLVYLTCLLNPVENEAVVNAALLKWGDQIELVDCSDRLAGLVRRPGLETWKVYNKAGEEISSIEELKKKQEENAQDNKIAESVFPPEDGAARGLSRCMRVYPHLQNTGGFFIAVFEKKGESEDGEEPPAKKQRVQLKKEKLPRDANEEPFIFLSPTNEVLKSCESFYEISKDFPIELTLVRNATGEPIRSVYFVAPIIRKVIEENEHKLKFIHLGLKLFVSQKLLRTPESLWRLQNESMAILKPYIGLKRQICISDLEALKLLLTDTFPSVEKLKELSTSLHDQLTKITDEGCCFLQVQREGAEDILLPLWRGRTNVNLMVNKHDTYELLYRIFGIEQEKEAKVETKERAKEEKEEEVKEIKDEEKEKDDDVVEVKEEAV